MAQAVATKVWAVVITSSPGPTSAAIMARCRAFVPLFTATHCSICRNSEKDFSKAATSGPLAKAQLSNTLWSPACTSDAIV